MIVALLEDASLRGRVRRAAALEEDLFWREADVRDALARGFPRVVVLDRDRPDPLVARLPRLAPGLPTLAFSRFSSLGGAVPLRDPRRPPAEVLAPDAPVARVREVLRRVAPFPRWIDELFVELGRVTGLPLPRGFRGLARRVLEAPFAYEDLHDLTALTGLSRGALKARFRRRDLRSPYAHLRWLRVLAAAHLLSDPEVSTEEAAFRLGYTHGGNLCRTVQSVSGLSPTEVRTLSGRTRLAVAFAHAFLGSRELAAWRDLDELFLRVA